MASKPKTKQKTRRGRVRKRGRVSKKNKQYGGAKGNEIEQLKTKVDELHANLAQIIGVSRTIRTMVDDIREDTSDSAATEGVMGRPNASAAPRRIPLPFLGATPGSCEGIRNNHGLYTQCQKVPTDGKFCKTCALQATKNAHGMPNSGTIDGRELPTWRPPSGQQPVTYASFLQKDGNLAHVLADHSIAEEEAAKFGRTIPDEQWVLGPRRQGRPKVTKSAVVTDSDD